MELPFEVSGTHRDDIGHGAVTNEGEIIEGQQLTLHYESQFGIMFELKKDQETQGYKLEL